jgi:hypothetical protein
MRLLPPALVALLCAPAAASAAPFGELPFEPLDGAGPATCVHAAGAGRAAVAKRS